MQDIEISSDILAGFKQHLAARPTGAGSGIDMSVLVLTSGFWPTYRSFDCLLPTELLKAQQVRLGCCSAPLCFCCLLASSPDFPLIWCLAKLLVWSATLPLLGNSVGVF